MGRRAPRSRAVKALAAILLALAAIAGAALAGCGEDDGEATASPDPELPADGPLISYTRSGGIAFTVQQLEVDADGDATLTLQQGPKPETREVELTEEELDSLREEVAAIDPAAVDVETEITCADCYEYELVFPDGEELTFAEYPDPPAELEPLLAELGRIVERNSPANPIGG